MALSVLSLDREFAFHGSPHLCACIIIIIITAFVCAYTDVVVVVVVSTMLYESSGVSASRSSLVGVAISLTGNVLISLALNCQKLAHLRLQREAQGLDPDELSDDEGGDDGDGEHQPLLRHGAASSGTHHLAPHDGYGSASHGTPRSPATPKSRDSSQPSSRRSSSTTAKMANGQVKPAEVHDQQQQQQQQDGNGNERKESMSTEFLRSRLWWLGLGLMTLGELGNFLSYGFAPASLVAPLGAVALLSNVIISPILLKEHFRPSDLGGIALAIVGAVTVVFSSKQNDPTLTPDQLLQAILRTEFIVYVCIVVALIALLVWASSTSWGDRYIMVDVGVCALFGGFTVLSTKGLSSFLSQGKPWMLLRYPITYGLIVVLVGTALAQITYLNRALQRFDSREVIPTQFVMFTISAITGSAILYQDFANMDVHRLINFLFGCLTTFAGVFFLTRSKAEEEGDGDEELDVEYVDEEASEHAVQSPPSRTSQPVSSPIPVAIPRIHPAAANAARRGRRRLRSKRSIVGFTSGSVPTLALHRAPGAMMSTSLQETGSVPVVVARRSIFNPAFTIAYLDPSLPATPRRTRG